LHFKIDTPVIKNVFFEKAFRWGSSANVTKILTLADTLSSHNNEPKKPYNISIEYLKFYNGNTVYIPEILIYKNKPILSDTIYLKVFLSDSLAWRRDPKHINNNMGKYILKIWE